MNVAVPPSSHKAEMDIKDLAIFGNLYAILALNGKLGRNSCPECVACMVLSSGSATIGPFLIGFWLSNGTLMAT